jgi:hypothetical protein
VYALYLESAPRFSRLKKYHGYESHLYRSGGLWYQLKAHSVPLKIHFYNVPVALSSHVKIIRIYLDF